jgi:hypothetical protein
MFHSFMNSFTIKKTILRNLNKKHCWNEKHTAFENTYRGFPSHLRGIAKQEAILLIKEGLILEKYTNYGLQVSLNIEKEEEIMGYLD